MNDTIKIKGGTGNVPALQNRELAYSKDEKALYIGTNNTASGNIKLCDAGQYEREMAQDNKISALEGKMTALEGSSFVTREYVDSLVAEINTRLDALTPSE